MPQNKIVIKVDETFQPKQTPPPLETCRGVCEQETRTNYITKF